MTVLLSLLALEAHKSYRCFQTNLTACHPYPSPVPSSFLFIQRVLDKLVHGQKGLFKTRDITLLTKVHRLRAMVSSNSHVWMWELDYKESWALKNWCFSTVVLEKLLRVPWTVRRSKQSILKEISPWIFIGRTKGLKLKLQSFAHLLWRADSLEKTLMLGKIEGRRRRGQQRMRWLDGITNSMDINLSQL